MDAALVDGISTIIYYNDIFGFPLPEYEMHPAKWDSKMERLHFFLQGVLGVFDMREYYGSFILINSSWECNQNVSCFINLWNCKIQDSTTVNEIGIPMA